MVENEASPDKAAEVSGGDDRSAKAAGSSSGNLQWYVVHTYSGYEASVKRQLTERIRAAGREHQFGEILVPAEQVIELVKGKKRTATRNLFPGYILVQMELTDETWHLVNDTPKVTGFVGGSTNPPPIPEEEVQRIATQIAEGATKPRARVLFEVGEQVKVIDGPFADFNGVVEEVRPDKGTLKVSISIFGRSTSVEMELVQVEKV
ncbi:MAG: transcription termination/antitermination protein NusG [Deltaproteobacteria bacterium]|nr:MAG: transcription termination/antitermination protein NusG [Deltaproteobacteria bacterium]